MSCLTWILFVSLLWIHACCVLAGCGCLSNKGGGCKRNPLVVADNFTGVIDAKKHLKQRYPNLSLPYQRKIGCIVFMQTNPTKPQKRGRKWLRMVRSDVLSISKWHTKRKNLHLYVLKGTHCNTTVSNIPDSTCVFNHNDTGPCKVRCLETKTICEESSYEENKCTWQGRKVNNRYLINITTTNSNCLNCKNPVKRSEKKIQWNETIIADGEEINAAQAAGVMDNMADLATSISVSSAEVTVGQDLMGIIVRKTDSEDLDEVSFAYVSPNDSMSIIEDHDTLAQFPRSVTVSKEAFEKASLNGGVPFVAVFRFNNLASDEKNSTVLGEVLAVEMGTVISNLTDKIGITFQNMTYKGIPSCQSWNGEGSRPNWTDDGCQTIQNGTNIMCECSHLTFFAILLAPPNETISSSDLNTLTIITQVGCGLSMFFLSIVLFMHFLLRKGKASVATKILIHLIAAMFMLNLTFLINNYVANLKNSVGCQIMAALMHYFMLTTFTWFAVQAFHLCLQLYTGGKIAIRHYILKVSITSWVLPSVVGIVLISLGKYGEQVIHTDDSENTVAMCWITDSDVHYIVNIGYYSLVFLFTFTTFIVVLSWLFCLKRISSVEKSTNGKNIVTILGLCCMLGVTWGFAFFAYGPLRIPSYYIFSALNSFQGFFLFIYYYNTSNSGEVTDGVRGHNQTSSSTLKTSLDTFENPYVDPKK